MKAFIYLLTRALGFWNAYTNPLEVDQRLRFYGVLEWEWGVYKIGQISSISYLGVWNLVACCLIKRNSLNASCSVLKGLRNRTNTVKRNSFHGMEVLR